MLYYQTLLHFLLIGLVAYAHDCLVQDSTSNEAATITDPRWRLQAGLIATTTYSLYTQAIQQGQPPLVNTTDYQGEENRNENSVGTSLEVAIDAVCQLVSVYELVTSAGNESELETVLRANLEDSCNWLNYLINNVSHVTSSAEFESLPSSCSGEGVTRLHHYCLERQIRTSQLEDLVRNISVSLNRKYLGLAVTSPQNWLQSTSIPTDQQTSISQNI